MHKKPSDLYWIRNQISCVFQYLILLVTVKCVEATNATNDGNEGWRNVQSGLFPLGIKTANRNKNQIIDGINNKS